MDKCITFPDSPHLGAGWGCHMCKTYNGDVSSHCRICDHPRCDELPEVLRVPIRDDDGKIKVVPVHTNAGNKSVN